MMVKFFMKDKYNEVIRIVNQWIDIVEEDLKFAKHGLSISSGVSYRIITFHSQQCVEKYLKAFLLFHGIDFPHTHNIITLLDLCSEIDKSFERLRKAEILTSYATASRYPGEYGKLRKSEALSSIKLSEMVRLYVRNKFIEDGLKLKKT